MYPTPNTVTYLKSHDGLITARGLVMQCSGDFSTEVVMSQEQIEVARFHFALCKGMLAYRAALRIELNDPTLELSERMLDNPRARRMIATVAE